MSQLPAQPRYEQTNYWRNYLPFLPASLRLNNGDQAVETWWAWRGASIHLDHYPAEAASLTVIILHGGGGYGRLLAPYAQMLHQQGFEVIAPDLPGYGLTQTPDHLIDHDRWVECVVDLVQRVKRSPDHPVVLLGCSLGGYLAYLAAARSRAVSAIIATTLADPRQAEVQRRFARFPRLLPLTRPFLPLIDHLFGRLRLPIKWFSNMRAIANEPALSALFCQDPFGGGRRVPIHFLYSVLTAAPDVEPEYFAQCPVLLIHPADDRWTPLNISAPFFNRIRAPKQLVLLENAGHFPVEEPGVNQMLDAIVAFLRKQDNTTGSASSVGAS